MRQESERSGKEKKRRKKGSNKQPSFPHLRRQHLVDNLRSEGRVQKWVGWERSRVEGERAKGSRPFSPLCATKTREQQREARDTAAERNDNEESEVNC
jgi:hypothetical protein